MVRIHLGCIDPFCVALDEGGQPAPGHSNLLATAVPAAGLEVFGGSGAIDDIGYESVVSLVE